MMTHKILKGLLITALSVVASNGIAASNVTVDNGTTLFGADISSITIDPASGEISIFTKSGNWGLSQSGTTNPPTNNDPIPTVVVKVNGLDSLTVDLNTDVTLAWSVDDAASCETLGGNAAWDNLNIGLTNGSSSGQAVVKINYVSTVTFTLRCSNGGNIRQDSVSITGESIAVGDADCPAVGDVDVVDWDQLDFKGGPYTWPQPGGDKVTIRNSRTRPVAIRFNTSTSDLVDTKYGRFTNVPIPGNEGVRQISVSECPGDFDVELTCRKEGTSSLWWEIDNSKGYAHTCQLAQGAVGKTYYLNVRFPDACGGPSTCSSSVGSSYY
jgi:hypothetical protein